MPGTLGAKGRQNRNGSFYCGTISNADIDALEDVAEIDVSLMNTLWVIFTVATNALTAFQVQVRNHPTGSYYTVASTSGNFTSPSQPMLHASGDLTGATTSGTHAFQLDVSGIESVKIRAAGTNSVLSGTYSGN